MKNKNIITHITKAALAVALILISLVAKAAVTTEPSGTCGNGLTYTFNSETGALVISKTGEGSCGMKAFAFDKHEDIKSVTIEEGVKGIGDCAFRDCTNLTSVTIPESVTTVGAYAFMRCINLENVYIYFNPDKLDFWSVWGDDFITDPKGATKGHVFAKYLEGFEKFKERTGINLTFVGDVTQLTADDITTSHISTTYSCPTPEIEVKCGDKTLIPGTDYEVSYSDNTNVGTAKATIKGIKLYIFTKEVEFTINPAPVTVTAENKTKTFGESDPEFNAKIEGLVNNESPDLIKYTLTRTEGENVGEYVITPKGDEIQGNYVVRFVDGKLTITPAPVTVTAENNIKTFGESDPEFTATITGLVNNESPDLIKYTISRTEGENTGEYTITAKGDEKQGNYVVSFVDGKLTINPAPVTVTAENKTKTFGESDPEFTAKIEGLVNNESPDLIKYTFSRTEGENVGEYTITAKGDEKQGNYEVSFVDATLTITKATPNPEPDSQNPSTPVSSIDNGGNNVKVWSYAHTIYIASTPDSQYKIIDLQGRTIKSATTKSSYEEVNINNSGIYVVIINGKSYKVSL